MRRRRALATLLRHWRLSGPGGGVSVGNGELKVSLKLLCAADVGRRICGGDVGRKKVKMCTVDVSEGFCGSKTHSTTSIKWDFEDKSNSNRYLFISVYGNADAVWSTKFIPFEALGDSGWTIVKDKVLDTDAWNRFFDQLKGYRDEGSELHEQFIRDSAQ